LGDWVKAGIKNEVGNADLFSFDHKEKKILLANLDGKLFATHRICTHE